MDTYGKPISIVSTQSFLGLHLKGFEVTLANFQIPKRKTEISLKESARYEATPPKVMVHYSRPQEYGYDLGPARYHPITPQWRRSVRSLSFLPPVVPVGKIDGSASNLALSSVPPTSTFFFPPRAKAQKYTSHF